MLLNRSSTNKRMTCCAFIDYSIAFDSVCRNTLYSKLKDYGISSKMLKRVMGIYRNVKSCVKNSNMHSVWFTCIDGLRQGDGISPILFAMSINDLSKKLSVVDCDRDIIFCCTQMI